MPKIKTTLNKTSTTKLAKFFKKLIRTNSLFESEDIQNKFKNYIISDIRYIRDCSEKSIVDSYILYGEQYLLPEEPLTEVTESIYKNIIKSARAFLAKKYTNKEFDNNIDIYFNDVKREYINLPASESLDLEFLPENRDIFIKNNLKLVVSCAKSFRNMGMPFEDLIQAGNLGLLTAFEKFDASRDNLRKAIIDDITNNEKESFTKEDAVEIITNNFKYNALLNKTVAAIPATGFDTKDAFVAWVKTNVKKAVFASVAYGWIAAGIRQELTKYGMIVRFPRENAKKNKNEDDDYEDNTTVSHTIIRLDGINPYTDDNYTDNELAPITSEEFALEDSYIVNQEREELFRSVVENAMSTLGPTECRLVKKKFGIDLPYSLSNSEIAENEGLSVKEVKSKINKALAVISDNIPSSLRDSILELMN